MKILIYGVGDLGSLLKDFFYSKGYYVRGYDIEEGKKDTNDISEFDVIFICVPMGEIKSALSHIRAEAKKDALLIDVASVKSISLPLFEKSGFDFLSIHPMFGKDSEFALSNIIIVHESGREDEKIIINEFVKTGSIITRMSSIEHDIAMKKIQGFTHFLLLAFSEIFEDFAFGTQIYNVFRKLSSRYLSQNWEMCYLIQKNAEKEREEFIRNLLILNELIKDKESFRRLFYSLSEKIKDSESSNLILEICKIGNYEDLEKMRGTISVIDSITLKLLEKRVEIAKKIAEKKKLSNEPIEVKEVEEEKIRWILKRTKLNPLYVEGIFSKIIELTKEEEYSVLGINKTVAVLGPKGSFSEEIALKLVGSRLPLRYCATTDEIIKLVESGEVDYGIIPIENSVNGTVLPVLDSLLSHEVEVFGETKLEVNHCLVAKRELKFNEIKVIYSHPQAIAQCMGFINNYLSNAEIRYTSSTSDAVRLLDEFSSAIISENAAKLYKLVILRRGIQDLKERNITRFYAIRRKSGKMEGKITSLFFAVEDKPGALKNVLEIFYRKGINLRKLESRPARTGLGDYIFFVEVEAPLNEEDVRELKEVTTFYKIIGVFDEIEKLKVY
ncbi:MAG: prephenate dehydratase [Archaeoglobaceae archaeon]|nr:prephenate dehydratase [Archaeoglobaceae archaeon]MDW7989259.1 prephenate dehydratase [Archaeoglobaceae archaeon]